MLLEYAKQHKAYRLLNTTTGKVFISRSVTFAETAVDQPRKVATPSVIDVVGDGEDNPDPSDRATSDEGICTPVPGSPIMTPDSTEPMDRPDGAIPTLQSSTPGRDGEQGSNVRPVRKKQAIKRYEQEFPNLRRAFNLDDYDASYEAQYCFSAEEDGESASTYDQVLQGKYKNDWMRAMESEVQSLTKHDTWTLQDLPSNKRSIGCKWIFRIKRKPNG